MFPTILPIIAIALVVLSVVGMLAGVALVARALRASLSTPREPVRQIEPPRVVPEPERPPELEPEPDDEAAPVDDDVQARLLVLRAFLVARRTDGGRHEAEVRTAATARIEDPALKEVQPARSTLWRGLFYALVLAELDRGGDPVPWRRIAKGLADRLARDDENPYRLYLGLVEATTNMVDSGNYRDFTRNGVPRLIADERAAAMAVGVTADEVEEHRSFLFEHPIARWR